MVNLIAQKLITEPRAIDLLYERLPPGVRDHIAERDASGQDEEKE